MVRLRRYCRRAAFISYRPEIHYHLVFTKSTSLQRSI